MRKIWILCTAIAVLSSCVKSSIDEAAYLRVATVPMTLSVPMAEVDDDTLTRIEVDEKSDTEWTFKWEENDSLFAVVDLDGGDGVQFSMDTYDEKVSTFKGTVYDANYNMRLIHPYERDYSMDRTTGMLYEIDLSTKTDNSPYMISEGMIAINSGSTELSATPYMKHIGAFMTIDVEFTNIVEGYDCYGIEISGVPSSAVIDMTKSVDDDDFFQSQTEGSTWVWFDDYIEITSENTTASATHNILPFELKPNEEITITFHFTNYLDSWGYQCDVTKKNETDETIEFNRATFNTIITECDMSKIYYSRVSTEEYASDYLDDICYMLPHKMPYQTTDSNGIKRTGIFRHMAGVTLSDEGAIGRPTTGNQFMPQLNGVTADTWESQGVKCEDYSVGRYKYIRQALIYRDNVGIIPNVSDDYVNKAKAEIDVVMAIAYFEMMKRYGAMPIITSQDMMSDATSLVSGERPSLKEFVETVDEMLANAIPYLSDTYETADISNYDRVTITKATAYFLRSRLWMWAASPLFNKRSAADYTEATGHEGLDFINYSTSYDATLWDKATQYTKEALDYCLGAGYKLVNTEGSVYKNLLLATSGVPHVNASYPALSTNGNTECILFTRRITYTNRNWETAMHPYGAIVGRGSHYNPITGISSVDIRGMGQAVSQNHVNMYRNADGSMPWSDDFLTITDAQREHYAKNSDPWSGLEPRFAANVLPDRYIIEGLNGQYQYLSNTLVFASAVQWVLGYQMKRFCPDESFNLSTAADFDVDRVDVVMRLAELYLNYAECLWNQGNISQAMEYLKPTMARGGLETSTMTFPTDSDTAWDWIMRERAVELFAEEFRYFDCKRWLKGDWIAAERVGAMAITDYNGDGNAYINSIVLRTTGYGFTYPDDYVAEHPGLTGKLSADDPGYVIKTGNEYVQYVDYTFNPVQYLWPIVGTEISKNIGWEQNPGY